MQVSQDPMFVPWFDSRGLNGANHGSYTVCATTRGISADACFWRDL